MSAADGQRTALHTGGCQCGAVRFAVYAEPIKIGTCHCRMCQKAISGAFVVLAEVAWGDFAWTRGSPSTFASSSRAVRDFCAACGTPLSYRHPGGPIVELLSGAFDQPQRIIPTYATGLESKLGWLPQLTSLPGKTTLADGGAEKLAAMVNYQHPDHDI